MIGSNPEDKDTASIAAMNRIGTRVIGKTIRKRERDFNTKEVTNMKDNSKTA